MKETPAEAEIISHKLLLRAGLVRKLTGGLYTFLPLGLRALRKIEAIVREEGFDSRVEVDIYDDVDLIEAALRRDEVDVVTLVAQDYLSLEDTGLLEPTFLTMRGEDVLEHSVLLVRADRDVE